MTYEEYLLAKEKRLGICIEHMNHGVRFTDIETAYIDETVVIGEGTLIGPCVTLEGNTVIGKKCSILQNTRIKDSNIGDEVEITASHVLESKVGDKTKVGPFAYLRPKSDIGKNCKVGDFVEVKNSTFGDGSKASHLTYIGDSDVGRDVNLGCGVVFVNYDGTNKFRSTIGDGTFIGCNTNLISPVNVEKGAYIAAGSTVTEDVPENALCIARSRQTNIEGWAETKGLYRKNK